MTIPKRAASLVAAAMLSGTLALGGCVAVPPPANVEYVREGPPPPRAEVVVVRPGPGFFWIRGHWRWYANAYDWVPGRWEHVPPGYRAWHEGHWRHDRNGWFWVEGRWR